MKKVLFISHKYPPSVGGMQKQSYHLINGMKKHAQVLKIVYHSNVETKLWFFLKLRSRVKEILDQHPDIESIHLNDGLMAAFTLWLKRETSIPVYVTFHGLDLTFPSRLYQKWVIPKLYRYDGFIAVSKYTAMELIKRGFPKRKISIINNGVDIPKDLLLQDYSEQEVERQNPEESVILLVGRPVKRKGFLWFVQNVVPLLPSNTTIIIAGSFTSHSSVLDWVLSRVPRGLAKQLFLFFGYPDDKVPLMKWVKANQLESTVSLLPKVSYDDLKKLYSSADVFVMPNIKVKGDMEGFGLVALESIMNGCPVVASGIEGIKDAVKEHKNGYLVESENIQAWASLLNSILRNKKHIKDDLLRQQIYTRDMYSWNKMCSRYADILLEEKPSTKQLKLYKAYVKRRFVS